MVESSFGGIDAPPSRRTAGWALSEDGRYLQFSFREPWERITAMAGLVLDGALHPALAMMDEDFAEEMALDAAGGSTVPSREALRPCLERELRNRGRERRWIRGTDARRITTAVAGLELPLARFPAVQYTRRSPSDEIIAGGHFQNDMDDKLLCARATLTFPCDTDLAGLVRWHQELEAGRQEVDANGGRADYSKRSPSGDVVECLMYECLLRTLAEHPKGIERPSLRAILDDHFPGAAPVHALRVVYNDCEDESAIALGSERPFYQPRLTRKLCLRAYQSEWEQRLARREELYEVLSDCEEQLSSRRFRIYMQKKHAGVPCNEYDIYPGRSDYHGFSKWMDEPVREGDMY